MPRALIKTITYGLMHLTVAIAVAYALTRDIRAALAIGIIEPLVQTFAYSFHERIWQKVPGRKVPGSKGCAHTLMQIRDHEDCDDRADGPDRPVAAPA